MPLPVLPIRRAKPRLAGSVLTRENSHQMKYAIQVTANASFNGTDYPECLSEIMSLKTLLRGARACIERRTGVQHASSDQALSGLPSTREIPNVFNDMIPDRH